MQNSVICGICKTSFTDFEEVTRHMAVHIRVKMCGDCGEYYPHFPPPFQHTCDMCNAQNRDSQHLVFADNDCSKNISVDERHDNSEFLNQDYHEQEITNLRIETQGMHTLSSNLISASHNRHIHGRRAVSEQAQNQTPKYHVYAEWSEVETPRQGKDGESTENRCRIDKDGNKGQEDIKHVKEFLEGPDVGERKASHDGVCVTKMVDTQQWTSEDENDEEDSGGTNDSDKRNIGKSVIDSSTSSNVDYIKGALRADVKHCEKDSQSSYSDDVSGDEDPKASVDTEEFNCQICGKDFESSRARKVHQATHPGGFVSDCQFCGKHFKNGSNLARHMRMHRGEKPFKCKICGKRYADHKTVLIHERVHTGERPHKCEKCGKRFSNPKSYRYHMKQHVGKRMKCETCGKTFASSANLSVHMRTHGNKEFMCDICDKGFYQLGNLRRHQRTHDGEEEFGTEMVMELDVHDGVHTKSTHIRRKKRHLEEKKETVESEPEISDESLETAVKKRSSPRRHKVMRRVAQRKVKRNVSGTLQCGICERVFTDYSSLKNHIELHIKPETSDTKNISNNEIGQTDLEQGDTETNAAVLKRKMCKKSFSQQVDLKEHTLKLQNDKGRKSIAYGTCAKVLILKKTAKPPYQCDECENDSNYGDTGSREDNSDSGVVAGNTSGEQSDSCIITPEKGRRKYKKAVKNRICEICGKAYSSVKRLKLHRLEHDSPPEAINTCETCGKSFNRLSGLTRHRKSHAKSRVFACEYCEKVFSCKSKQEIHTRTHTGERPYKCGYCDKTFAAKSGYHQHRQLHEFGKVRCQVCSKILTNKSYLKRHMRIHTQEKPYTCQICGEAFYMYGTYRNHRLAHQGIPPKVYTKKQPATCEVCGKYFLSKYYLISHMRLHTGEKPFVCDICGRGFVQGHGLRRHLQFHEKEKARPEKKFQCQVCHNFYPDLKNLQRHMIYHNRERNCRCQICDKAYIRPSHLKRHMIDTHKINPKTTQKPTSLPQPPAASVSQAHPMAHRPLHPQEPESQAQPMAHPPLHPQEPVQTSFHAPVPVASVSQHAEASAPAHPPAHPSAHPSASMPPPAMTQPLLHPQQYQQINDSLQIHTMEPAMFTYY